MTEHSTSAADIDACAARAGRAPRPRVVAGGLAAALLLPAALLPGLAAGAQQVAQSSGTGSTAMPELSPAPATAPAKKPSSSKASSTTTTSRSSARYTVRSGDSLWTICERLTGPGSSPTKVANALVKLWNANDVHIGTGDPDMLPTGSVLKVPAALR